MRDVFRRRRRCPRIELCHGSINPKGVRGELMPGLVMARLLMALLTGNDKLLR